MGKRAAPLSTWTKQGMWAARLSLKGMHASPVLCSRSWWQCQTVSEMWRVKCKGWIGTIPDVTNQTTPRWETVEAPLGDKFGHDWGLFLCFCSFCDIVTAIYETVRNPFESTLTPLFTSLPLIGFIWVPKFGNQPQENAERLYSWGWP